MTLIKNEDELIIERKIGKRNEENEQNEKNNVFCIVNHCCVNEYCNSIY